MDGNNAGGRGDGGGESSGSLTEVLTKGDRILYKVELRPWDTTVVSWKKLVREGNCQLHGSSSEIPGPTSLVSCPMPAPGQRAEIEKNHAQPAHRFSSVIEKIERLYMGNDSGDEDDLNDVPHDDEYDTEDSFIDDTELDEYFKVDYSTTKHDGFFISRGNLEKTEPPVQPQQQPKKRGRKDIGKAQGANDNDCVPNKRLKGDKTTGREITASHEKNIHPPSQGTAVAVTVCEDRNVKRQKNASKTNVKKIQLDKRTTAGPCSIKVPNGNHPSSLVARIDLNMQNTGASQLSICSEKLRAAAGGSDASHQNCSEKIAAGRSLYNVDEHESSARSRDNNALVERSNVVDGTPARSRETNGLSKQSDVVDSAQHPMQMKTPHTQKKDASSVRLRRSMLEKAIRELEKMVSESSPPAMENQEADVSQQAIKRRLPREIKQKLAKVAHLAQASHGKISKELLNRLMSFLGHLMQLRTLKRNLKEMISTGMSSKQEKNDGLKEIKKELIEMIKMQVSLLESKARDQHPGPSDHNSQKNEAQRRLCLDAALEDKICDLYDLYVDGLDEGARPLIRKLYAELAQLWPNNLMNNHGIKQAICNAKERRRALRSGKKDQEKSKKKRVTPSQEEVVRAKASLVAQPQSLQERLTDGWRPGTCSISVNKQMPSTMAGVRRLSPTANSPSLDELKQKSRGGSSGSDLDAAKLADNNYSKNKKKKKRENELDRSKVTREISCKLGGGATQISQAAYT